MVEPTEQGRFIRSLYDVDRSKPSPFEWRRWSAAAAAAAAASASSSSTSSSPSSTQRYVRRLGLVEAFFNTMGTLHEGRTDIFYRLPLRCPASGLDRLMQRIPLAWAILCRRHPLLCARIANLTPDLQEISSEEANGKRQNGESSADGSVSFEPHFIIDVPESVTELLRNSSERVVWADNGWRQNLPDDSESEASRSTLHPDDAVRWMDQYLWNGKRRFLCQTEPFGLASLIVLPSVTGSVSNGTSCSNSSSSPSPDLQLQKMASFDLILCSAHCISDALSVSNLAAELLQILTSPDVSMNLPDLNHHLDSKRELVGTTTASYAFISQEMRNSITSGLPANAPQNAVLDDFFHPSHLESLLPPCLESAYPELLPSPIKNCSPSSKSRKIRLRWFWSIRKVICQNKAEKLSKVLLSDFKAERSIDLVKAPWWGAQTRWSTVRVSKETTTALTRLCKRKAVRVGCLLYGVASLALNTLEKEAIRPGTRLVEPDHTVIGFPMSIRKYLDPIPPLLENDPTGAVQTKLPPEPVQVSSPSQLGVWLGFNGVHLPPADVFALASSDPQHAQEMTSGQAAQLWQAGRSVQRQLDALFSRPHLMMADGFLVALERENRFRKSGVQDVFQVPKDSDDEADQQAAGADERRPGLTKKNMQGPGSSLNFSMVGHLDHILPSSLPLPSGFGDPGSCLEVDERLMFGVRNRAGEAFGTSFTFRDQLNLELGHDAVVWDTAKVEQYLELMKCIIEGLVHRTRQ